MTEDRAAFLAERAEGLGSTDSSAILGLSPWAGPFSVYQDKVGESVEREPSLPMWLGLQLQRTVAELFVTRTGLRVRASNVQHKHPVFDYIRCHLDYRVVREAAVLEVKTARSTDGWGEEGSSDIPPWYWVQVQHQLAVTQLQRAFVATLFGHYDFRYYEVYADEDFQRSLVAALVEFWTTHVVPRVPPPLDGSEDASRFVRSRYPADTEPAIPATPEQGELVAQLINARKSSAAALLREQELTNRVKDLIGTRAGLIGSGWTISWRRSKPSHEVSWSSVAKAIEPFVPEGEYQAAVAANTEVKEGRRPFILRYEENESDEPST